MRRFYVAALGAALIAGLVGAAPAQAATTLKVHAGAGLGRTVPAFTNRMFAPEEDGVPTVKVMKGDTINFVGLVALIPEKADPYTWWTENGTEMDSSNGFFAGDPDADFDGFDGPTKLNAWLFGPQDGCGAAADNACLFKGSEALNPINFFGAPRAWVQIDANAGSELWAVPPFGTPTQDNVLKIEVVDDPAQVTTQESLDSYFKTARAEDIATAESTFKAMQKPVFHEEDGHRVYDAHAGYESGTIHFLAMFPHKLRLRKGDRVEWHFDFNFDLHTATFPFKRGNKLANETGFAVACDPDGDGPGPDALGNFESQTPCEDMREFEFDISRKLSAKAGDGVFPGGFENSGIKGVPAPSTPDMAGGTEPWSLTFTKASSDEGYRYVCAIHGKFMNGRVVVR